MARVTINDVKTSLGITETYDIVNAIRNSAGDSFQKYVPLASADNIGEVGAGIQINQTIQNEFITSLVDRIGLVVIRNVSLTNPLAKFKKGMMPLGRTIEEIFTDITKAKKYDPEDAENTVFAREIPNVKTLFHERNRQDFYHQTIQDDSLKTAFISWGNFEGFVASIINAIYSSAEVDEYEYMMMLVDNYYSKGLFAIETVDKPDTETTAKELVKKMREVATNISLPMGTRDYNALAVRTRTDMSDVHLLITSKLRAQLDVEVLASAFNMDKATLMGHITIVDKFATEGIEAVMIDREWYMVYDTLLKMETIRNPRGLYWNYYYHVWQVLSASRFANAIAFVSGDVPPVTQVIVDPTIATIKQGRTMKFNAFVRANDGNEYDVEWKVEKSKSTDTLRSATTIDNEGNLTIAENQEGQLLVTATVTYGSGEDAQDVVGEAVISVQPNNE